MSNYNKVKTEGKKELKKLDMWNRLLLPDQMVLERVLEIHADNIKKAVEEDEREKLEHEIRKLLDGWGHPKDCEICRGEITLKP